MITGFVVNHDRTKMLLHFHESADQWQPVGGWADSQECGRQRVLERVASATGMQAEHVMPGSLAENAHETTFVLQADESAVSPYELEEQYNAQWLDRRQIADCSCIHEAAREFALGYLKS